MKRLTVLSLAGVASIACLSVAVPATAETPSYMDAATMVPALSHAQTAEDRAIDVSTLKKLGNTDPSSVRLVGQDDLAKYFVGREGASKLCLIVKTHDSTSSSCATLSEFYRSGLSLATGKSLEEPETIAEAYLLPADVNSNGIGLEKSKARGISPAAESSKSDRTELVSVAPEEHAKLTATTIERDSGVKFQFTPLSLEPRR